MHADELAGAVAEEAAQELAKALSRIEHCLAQLSDEQIWSRPRPDMNSIGHLILHLTGNVRQWLLAGLGGVPNTRNRPAEFAEREPIAKQDLLGRLGAVFVAAVRALRSQSAEQLLAVRRIQGFDITGLRAIFDSVPHFRGHTQEIVSMTRLLLGDAYQFAWKPTTPEQGQ